MEQMIYNLAAMKDRVGRDVLGGHNAEKTVTAKGPGKVDAIELQAIVLKPTSVLDMGAIIL
jgi:hypothetical protein